MMTGRLTLPRWRNHRFNALCIAESERGYVCTRPKTHGGRHAACGLDGVVYDVWGPDVYAGTRAVARHARGFYDAGTPLSRWFEEGRRIAREILGEPS